jgi:hypothetical protein
MLLRMHQQNAIRDTSTEMEQIQMSTNPIWSDLAETLNFDLPRDATKTAFNRRLVEAVTRNRDRIDALTAGLSEEARGYLATHGGLRAPPPWRKVLTTQASDPEPAEKPAIEAPIEEVTPGPVEPPPAAPTPPISSGISAAARARFSADEEDHCGAAWRNGRRQPNRAVQRIRQLVWQDSGLSADGILNRLHAEGLEIREQYAIQIRNDMLNTIAALEEIGVIRARG